MENGKACPFPLSSSLGVGTVRFIQDEIDPSIAEWAAIVMDRYHGERIGSCLLYYLSYVRPPLNSSWSLAGRSSGHQTTLCRHPPWKLPRSPLDEETWSPETTTKWMVCPSSHPRSLLVRTGSTTRPLILVGSIPLKSERNSKWPPLAPQRTFLKKWWRTSNSLYKVYRISIEFISRVERFPYNPSINNHSNQYVFLNKLDLCRSLYESNQKPKGDLYIVVLFGDGK